MHIFYSAYFVTKQNALESHLDSKLQWKWTP